MNVREIAKFQCRRTFPEVVLEAPIEATVSPSKLGRRYGQKPNSHTDQFFEDSHAEKTESQILNTVDSRRPAMLRFFCPLARLLDLHP
jgi:hypothetical protein